MLRTAQASILIVTMHEPPNASPPEVDRFSAGVARRGEGCVAGLPAPLCVCINNISRNEEERVVAVPARW